MRLKTRSFVAVELPESTHEEIGRFLVQVKKMVRGVRWARPEAVHLTLRFLGEVDEAVLDQIRGRMNDVASCHRAFRLKPKEIGCFPSSERPRIIWLGLQGDLGVLEMLRREVIREVKDLPVKPEGDRTFNPHLTLGRVVDPRCASGITDIIYMGRSAPFEEFSVKSFALFKSDLTPSGAEYTRLAEFELKP